MIIYYCDKCGKRVPQAEVDAGSAKALDESRALCQECAPRPSSSKAARVAAAQRSTSQLPPPVPKKTTVRLSAPAPESEVRASRTTVVRREPAQPADSHKGLMIAGCVIGIASVVAVFVVLGSGPERPAKKETKATAANAPEKPGFPGLPPVTAPPSNNTSEPDPEKKGNGPALQPPSAPLAEARQFALDHPQDLWGYWQKLDALVKSEAETPAADEARKLLAELAPRLKGYLPGETAWAGAVDLFKFIVPERDQLQGTWKLTDGKLVCEPGEKNWCRLRVPYAPPEEYDVKFSFKRLQGDECVVLALAAQNHPFSFMLAGWKNKLAGFECIGGKRIPGGPFTLERPPILETNRIYEAVIQVRKNGLHAFLDGEFLLSAVATPEMLSDSPTWGFGYAQEPGLGLGHIGPYEFYELRLLPVSGGTGKPIDTSTLPSGTSVASSSVAGEQTVVGYDFGNDDPKGWTVGKGMEPFAFEGGVLVIHPTDADAYMLRNNMKVDTSRVTHLVFRMRTDKPGVTQVYYATSTGTDIAKNNVPSVDCQGDGLWHEYVVKLAGLKNFKGELRTLRLDPVNGNQAVGAKVEIHWIRLVRRPN